MTLNGKWLSNHNSMSSNDQLPNESYLLYLIRLFLAISTYFKSFTSIWWAHQYNLLANHRIFI